MGTAPFRTAFAVREFRALWAAEALSQAGDQLARVALSVLVWERTASAGLTGLTYGLTYLPTLIGGTLFAGLADRFPRRTVMVLSDLIRALMAALMAVPGTPLWLICALLVVLTTAGGPFRAAQLALLPDVLAGESYFAGLSIRNITIQSAQLAGFAGGGLALTWLTPSGGLLVNAATFLVSATFVWLGVHTRPPADDTASAKDRLRRAFSGTGAKIIWQDHGIRLLFASKMLAGFCIAPEGLAAPYADQLGIGTAAVGLLLAADPAGSVLGAWVFTRWMTTEQRTRGIGLFAIASVVPLFFLLLTPPLPLSLALIALSGALATPYHMQAVALMGRGVPDQVRARVMGLSSTALVTVQGLGIVLAGGLAQLWGANIAIGITAACGIALALPIAVAWRHEFATRPDRWLPTNEGTNT